MTSTIAVVTDSTSYLPDDLPADLPISVVPLHVIIGERSGEETSEITPAEVASALGDKNVAVSTSRPTPEHFLDEYERLLSTGVQQIVSVHISAELSGTWDSARTAAAECNGKHDREVVRVVDSRMACMGLGFVVIAAAEAARDAADIDKVCAAAEHTMRRTTCLFYVDTLEHLRRGGRIGAAQALVGTALAVKPLLQFADGRIVPLEKVRTASKAIARLEELAVEAATGRGGPGEVRIAVQHLASAQRAAAVVEHLAAKIPTAGDIIQSEVGAVVGAHVGPGLIGIVISRT